MAHAWATGCGKRLRARPWLLLPLLALAALFNLKFALAATCTVNTTADTCGSSGAPERVQRQVEARHTLCKNPGADAPLHEF